MLALIAAFSKNRVIGKNGKIPWEIPGEQLRFRRLTTGNVVIMGRKTYEEIGHPLPNRYTIVVSNRANYTAENCTTATSFGNALQLAADMGCLLTDKNEHNTITRIKPKISKRGIMRDCFVSGGEQLYRDAIDIVQKMYITEIEIEIDGDTFFPEFDESLFTREVCDTKSVNNNRWKEYKNQNITKIRYTYLTYTRRQ